MEALPSPPHDGLPPQQDLTATLLKRYERSRGSQMWPPPTGVLTRGWGSHGAALCIKCVGYNYTIRLRFNCRKTATVYTGYICTTCNEGAWQQFYSSIICKRNSDIADKPRDTFVQIQCCGWPQNMPLPTGVTTPNLLVPR